MGIIIKVNDADFENYVGLADYPKIASLENLYFMGQTQEKSLTDQSGKNHFATQVGSVDIQNAYATFASSSSTNYWRCQELPDDNFTGMSVAALIRYEQGQGNRAIFSGGGSSGFQFGAKRLIFKSDTDTSSRSVYYEPGDLNNNFLIMFWVISPTDYSIYTVHNENINLLVSGTGEGSSIRTGKGSQSVLKVLNVGGSAYGFAMDQTLDIACCGFYKNILLNNQQMKDIIMYLYQYAEKHNLPIM